MIKIHHLSADEYEVTVSGATTRGEGPHNQRSTFQAYLCDPRIIGGVPRLRSGVTAKEKARVLDGDGCYSCLINS